MNLAGRETPRKESKVEYRNSLEREERTKLCDNYGNWLKREECLKVLGRKLIKLKYLDIPQHSL